MRYGICLVIAASVFATGASAEAVRFEYTGPGPGFALNLGSPPLHITRPYEEQGGVVVTGIALDSINNFDYVGGLYNPRDGFDAGFGFDGSTKGLLVETGGSRLTPGLERGVLIGADMPGGYEYAREGVYGEGTLFENDDGFIWSGFETLLPLDETRYIGVKIEIGGASHFGWLEVTLRAPDGLPQIGTPDGWFRFDLTAWGYETDPGVPVPAGLPAPGAGVLAVLAVAYTSRRRRV